MALLILLVEAVVALVLLVFRLYLTVPVLVEQGQHLQSLAHKFSMLAEAGVAETHEALGHLDWARLVEVMVQLQHRELLD
jgi:hypothetical protein